LLATVKKGVVLQKPNTYRMESADKFEIFLKLCKYIFVLLLVLKITGVLSISYWIVFTPILIPILIIMYELGAFNN
jgi:hypothetical protein